MPARSNATRDQLNITGPSACSYKGGSAIMIGSGPGLTLRMGTEEFTRQRVKPGTLRRIIPYALRYRWTLVLLFVSTAVDSFVIVASPVILGLIIDDAILPRRLSVLVDLTIAAAGMAVADGLEIGRASCRERV